MTREAFYTYVKEVYDWQCLAEDRVMIIVSGDWSCGAAIVHVMVLGESCKRDRWLLFSVHLG